MYPRAVDLVRSGRVDVRTMVSDSFPLADAAKAFEVAVARTGLKVAVESA
jgi:L-iditol 2-dehydrogenase